MNMKYRSIKLYYSLRSMFLRKMFLSTEKRKYSSYLISMAYDNTKELSHNHLFFNNNKISKLEKIRLGIISLIFANENRLKIFSFIMWSLMKQKESKQIDLIMIHCENSID